MILDDLLVAGLIRGFLALQDPLAGLPPVPTQVGGGAAAPRPAAGGPPGGLDMAVSSSVAVTLALSRTDVVL